MSDLEQLLKEENNRYDAARKRLQKNREIGFDKGIQTELNLIEEHKKTIKSIKNQIKNS